MAKVKKVKDNSTSEVKFSEVKEWFDDNLDQSKIDLHDQEVYKYVYHDARYVGIFQCTSKGAQNLFKKAKPESIIDIATLTSIYRPGPLAANVDKIYLEAKQGKAYEWSDPRIGKILEKTYGCITGDALVTTTQEKISLEDIVNQNMVGLKVLSLNEDTSEIEQDEITAVAYVGTENVLELEFEDGTKIELTDDHRVMTKCGWVEAGQLTLSDEIIGIE